MTMSRPLLWLLCIPLLCTATRASSAAELVDFAEKPGSMLITVGGRQFATYVYRDEQIPRPFFANVYVPGGPKLTRNHPPLASQDDLDHGKPGEYFHPGIWLAFSDLNGNDYWRLKASVRHEGFVESPRGGAGQGTFVVRNSYRKQEDPDQVVCEEVCRYTISLRPVGVLLIGDSIFSSREHGLQFGDQEEMGLGVRVATPLAVKHGGRMIDSAGRVNQREIWGREAAWCNYGGTIGNQQVGVMLIPDPANPWTSRFHARDYGFFAANPFGRQVFGETERHTTVLPRGESLRLRFGALFYANPAGTLPDRSRMFDDAVNLMATLPRPLP
jgi:hypothetical protein